MLNRLKYAISILGAAALVSSVLTDALASKPAPFHAQVRSGKNQTVSGNLTVSRVARVNNNLSVYGRVYAHGGEQVWKTLTVKNGGLVVSGGTQTDSLTASTLSVSQQATISGNASVGAALTAGSVTSNGTVTAPTLTLSSGGKSAQLAVDANGNVALGSAGLTSTGALSAASVTSSGAITAGSITSTGTLTAGGLTVTGNVDLSKANVTGLNVSNLNLQNLALTSLSLGSATSATAPLALTENGQTETLGVDTNGALTVRSLAVSNNFTAGAATFSALTLGITSATSPALTLAENGKSTQIGVDANGNLTVGGLVATGSINATGGLTVGGTLTLTGATGLVTSTIAAPPATSGSTTPGALTLTGSSIALNGATTVSGGNDLSLSRSAGSGTAGGHLLAGGSPDVAGIAPITFPSSYGSGAIGTATVCFTKPFATQPIVTITADGDPAPNTTASNAAPKVYVQTFGSGTSSCSGNGGFTIHYTAPADATTPATPPTIQYFYHVIGS
jgi:hypothetical protein